MSIGSFTKNAIIAGLALALSGTTKELVAGDWRIGTIGMQAPLATGEATGVTDRANLNAITARSATLKMRTVVRAGLYIVDSVGWLMVSGANIMAEPGVTIKMCDKSVISASFVSGNPIVVVASTAGLVAGMQVSDPSANLQVATAAVPGPAFGVIQFGTNIVSVNTASSTVTLSLPPTATLTDTPLNFHPRSNVFKVVELDDWSVFCPGSFIRFDGNYAHSYPYDFNGDDANRNAIRIVGGKNWRLEGVEGYGAFYHGCIIVGQVSGCTVNRYKGTNNGFRGIHMHGEAITGNPTPEIRNNMFDNIELSGNGHRAWGVVRGGDEFNSGAFLVFSNVRNTQIGKIRADGEYGYGMQMSGGGGAFLPNFPSKYVQVAEFIADSCGCGLSIRDSMESAQFGAFAAIGKRYTIASAVFNATAAGTAVCMGSTGVVNTLLTKTVQLPAGQVSANSLRAGMRAFASQGTTGMNGRGMAIWAVDAATDIITLVDEDVPTAAPYTTAGTTTLYVTTAREKGLDLAAGAGTVVRNIKFGSTLMENPGRYGIYSAYSSSQIRFLGIDFGDVSITGASNLALYLSSMDNSSFASLRLRNMGIGLNLGGSYDSVLQNVGSGVTINNFTTEHDAAWTNNNEAMRIDVDSRGVVIHATSVRKPASGATINVLTVAGAAANAAGRSGPIILVNPRANDGTPLTVAAGHLARTAATACNITRPGPIVPATKTAAYTVTSEDGVILCDATTAAFTVNLPTAVTCPGQVFCIKKIDASANAVTISGATIDGGSSVILLTQYAAIEVQSNGTAYYAISKV